MKYTLQVLLLEANPNEASVVENTLNTGGWLCDFVRVGDYASYLQAMGREKFDVIIANYDSPDIDGLSALFMAQELCSDIPFIFISDAIDEEELVEILKSGATDCITKERIKRLPSSLHKALRETEERHRRRAAENALRESEDRYRLLYEDSPHMYFTIAEDGTVLYANNSSVEQLGYSLDEMIGHPVLNVFHPDDHKKVLESFQNCLNNPEMHASWEFRKIHKDGHVIWVREWARVIQGANGKYLVFVICEDVTEEKEAKEREFALGRILEESQNEIYIVELESFRYILANRGARENLGYTIEELRKLTPLETKPDMTPKMFHELLSPLLKGEKKIVEFTCKHLRKNGTFYPVEVHGQLGTYEGKRVLICVIVDISERQRSEEELESSRQQYEVLVNSIDGIVWEADIRTDKFTFVSKQAERILGYPLAQWLEEKSFWLNHLHPEDRDWAATFGISDIPEMSDYEMEYRMKAADGRFVWFRDLTRIVWEDNKPVKLCGIMVDVTQQHLAQQALRESEERLLQAQKMEAIGQLAGGVAHDFNNLLTVILGYSELLLNRIKVEGVVRDKVGEINRAADRAAALTRQLLAFSRKQVLQPKTLDLNDVVATLDKMLRRLIGEHIEFITRRDSHIHFVNADPGQIEQVLMNLVVNARDAMPLGGKLTISTSNVFLTQDQIGEHAADIAHGDYVMLSVSDTGHGMDDETKSRIFEPFFTTKEKGYGTGLGLSTAYGIIKQSGGFITVETEPESGTIFKVFLPKTEKKETVKQVAKREIILPRGTETILLVEDEDILRPLAKNILEGCGYVVLETSNGKDALEICEDYTGDIQLLLTDVVMPQINGRELAEKIMLMRPEICVIYMSGYTDDAVVRRGLIGKTMEFIQKPFTSETLAMKVREVLDGAQKNEKAGTGKP